MPAIETTPSLSRIWLTRAALSAAVLLSASCAPRLNQALAKLPQTPEHGQPLSAYTVEQVVNAATPCYPKVERTPAQLFVFGGNKIDPPMTFTIIRDGQSTTTQSSYSKVISLDHDGTRLTGGSSSVGTW
jgi:hypothetical protein